MQTLRNTILTLLFAMLLVAGCEHADPLDPNRLEPTLSSIQANIFDLNCALPSCHAAPNPQLGQDLSAGQARASIVNVRSVEVANLFRVAPGDPENSYLVWKIEGRAGIGGVRMPSGRAPLTAEEIAVIRQWIADGAQDN
jgi:hypothetical protein